MCSDKYNIFKCFHFLLVFASDCDDVWAAGRRRNGTYALRPLNVSQTFPAYCEIHADGGWTVIQHRYGT